jgi:putative ABC transport system ATP-binding protein
VVMGPSGSGKTTLLNIIGCLDRMDAGTYELDGQEIGGRDFNDLAELRNRKIGFIFQAFNLIPVLNVLENIEFPCLIRGGNRKELRALAHAKAREVGLEPFLAHRPDELSGGQRQRVAIARALITSPQLVLADEPTANLDSVTSEQILELMLKLNREDGVTFLFSTHDPRVTQHARRVIHIADGSLVDAQVS